MTNRRNLTPPPDLTAPEGTHGMRRGGPRREVSTRVALCERSNGTDGGRRWEGWALNVSRGGLRAILEEKVELGQEFDVEFEAGEAARRGRIVWMQEEPDGVIVGVEFAGLSGMYPSAPPPPNGADDVPPFGDVKDGSVKDRGNE